MQENTETTLTRDVDVIQIPSGTKVTLPQGTQVVITQALGGSFTIASQHGLARINDSDSDALGLDAAPAPVAPGSAEAVGEVEEEAVWNQLKTCYDPEIPVNIVDLGLVYDCQVLEQDKGGAKVNVKMTLTAPGCGMGPTIAAEARGKIMSLPGVSDADVELVWDPPWNQDMISEVGKMKLGMI